MRGLRGHDGAVHKIAWTQAIAAAASGQGEAIIRPATFEGRACILWLLYSSIARGILGDTQGIGA